MSELNEAWEAAVLLVWWKLFEEEDSSDE